MLSTRFSLSTTTKRCMSHMVEYMSHNSVHLGLTTDLSSSTPSSSTSSLIIHPASSTGGESTPPERIHPSQLIDVWPSSLSPPSPSSLPSLSASASSLLSSAPPGSLNLDPVWRALLGHYKYARMSSPLLAALLFPHQSHSVHAAVAASMLLAADPVFFKRAKPFASSPSRSDLLYVPEIDVPLRKLHAAYSDHDLALIDALFPKPGGRGYAPRSRQAVRTHDISKFVATCKTRADQLARAAKPKAWSRSRDLPLLLSLETLAAQPPPSSQSSSQSSPALAILRMMDLPPTPASASSLLSTIGHTTPSPPSSTPHSHFPSHVKTAADAVVSAVDQTDFHTTPARVPYTDGENAIYAIDAPSAGIIDDAISLDAQTGDVLVHVADPTPWIPLDSPLESAARSRVASMYVPNAPEHMLPPRVLAAMGFQTSRPAYALTSRIKLRPNGSIHSSSLERSVVGPVKRFTFGEAEEQLLSGHPDLVGLYAAASSFRLYRSRASSSPVPKHRLLEEPAKLLVQECMNMANQAAAFFASSSSVLLPGKRNTTITSPLRRYLDLVAHRNLTWALDGSQGPIPFDVPSLTDLVAYATNKTKLSNQILRDAEYTELLEALSSHCSILRTISPEGAAELPAVVTVPPRPGKSKVRVRLVPSQLPPESQAAFSANPRDLSIEANLDLGPPSSWPTSSLPSTGDQLWVTLSFISPRDRFIKLSPLPSRGVLPPPASLTPPPPPVPSAKNVRRKGGKGGKGGRGGNRGGDKGGKGGKGGNRKQQ